MLSVEFKRRKGARISIALLSLLLVLSTFCAIFTFPANADTDTNGGVISDIVGGVESMSEQMSDNMNDGIATDEDGIIETDTGKETNNGTVNDTETDTQTEEEEKNSKAGWIALAIAIIVVLAIIILIIVLTPKKKNKEN